jgi:hypothetical protein
MGGKSLWDRPLTIAAIGSVIAFMGQLFGTIIPIYLGPDISDYDLYCDPVYVVFHTENLSSIPSHLSDLDLLNKSIASGPLIYKSVKISAANLHPLQRYKHQIYLRCIAPRGIYSKFDNDVITTGGSTTLKIGVSILPIILQMADRYTVIIEGTGSDGKIRNCTLYVTGSLEDVINNPAMAKETPVRMSFDENNSSGFIAYRSQD